MHQGTLARMAKKNKVVIQWKVKQKKVLAGLK
jgi:hypothetical protein